MKKIYTTLLAVLIASVGFAQINPAQVRVPKENGEVLLPLNKDVLSNSKAGPGQFWYSYTKGLSFYWGSEFQGTSVVMLNDSIATFQYTDGPGRPQFYSIGQTYNFNSPTWETFFSNYTEAGVPIAVPDLSQTATYSIDSMSIAFSYQRGSNVPASVVDTLILSIAAFDAADEDLYMRLSINQEAKFIQPEIPFNREDATIDPSASSKFYTEKIPLTPEDTVETGYYLTARFPVTGLQNLSAHKTVFAAMTFKSGQANRQITDVIGTDLNNFRGIFYEDPRSQYEHSVSGTGASIYGPGLLEEKDVSLNAMEFTLQPDNVFTDIYVANAIWIAKNKRYLIDLFVTCNDCAFVGVKEMEKKNVTVYPNPATSQFTVNLDDNSAAQIQLYNLVGQLVHSEEVQNTQATVNVNQLNNGVYMLKVTQNGKVYTSKVVVK